MMQRRAFLGATLSAAALGSSPAAAQTIAGRNVPEPLVWPVVRKVPPGIRSFAGHTDTVPDIVGRIGSPPSLAIFTEGNHLMVLLSDDIVGAFPAWAKSQPQYADLDLENIVVVTLPQPVVVQMIRTGGIALGNLMLEVSRRSGFYPDIVMAGPEPLREIRKLGAIEPQARFFSRNRGPALLVRKGNPLGIHALTDVARSGARIALPNAVEAAGRARSRAAIEGLAQLRFRGVRTRQADVVGDGPSEEVGVLRHPGDPLVGGRGDGSADGRDETQQRREQPPTDIRADRPEGDRKRRTRPNRIDREPQCAQHAHAQEHDRHRARDQRDARRTHR